MPRLLAGHFTDYKRTGYLKSRANGQKYIAAQKLSGYECYISQRLKYIESKFCKQATNEALFFDLCHAQLAFFPGDRMLQKR